MFRCDALSVVLHLNQDIVPRRNFIRAVEVGLIDDDIRRDDIQLSPLSPPAVKGIAGVDGEVDNDLFKLSLIDQNIAQIAPMGNPERQAVPHQPPEQVGRVRQCLGHVEAAGLQGLLAGKGQQLSDKVRGPIGVLPNLHNIGKGLIPRAVTPQKQVCKANHCGQKVIKIMSDSPRQLSHRLHFLRLGKAGFEVSLIRDVNKIEERSPRKPCTHIKGRCLKTTGAPIEHHIDQPGRPQWACDNIRHNAGLTLVKK